MSSILKPDWWDTWVIQGLYTSMLRDDAPSDVKRAYKKFLNDQQMV